MVKRETIQRKTSPGAMLIGLPETLAAASASALIDGGLRVLRVGHVAAACERIPVSMPQVVVALAGIGRGRGRPWRTAAWRSGQDAANVALIRTRRSS